MFICDIGLRVTAAADGSIWSPRKVASLTFHAPQIIKRERNNMRTGSISLTTIISTRYTTYFLLIYHSITVGGCPEEPTIWISNEANHLPSDYSIGRPHRSVRAIDPVWTQENILIGAQESSKLATSKVPFSLYSKCHH